MRPMRHGYTNDSRTDGTVVVKRYEGVLRQQRRDTEQQVLGRLPGGLPVPRIAEIRADALVMPLLPGVPGQELIDAGHAGPVLHSCGVLLRRLGRVDVATVFPGATGRLVHGDFGPNNMLFDPSTYEVTALVDWEWCHPGNPIEDLAWCEWIVRMHHPPATSALDSLFDGYGRRPPWPERHAAALARCAEMVELTARSAAEASWRERAEITRAWTE